MALTQMLTLLLHDVYERERDESGFSGPGADRYKLSVAEFEAQLVRLAAGLQAAPVLVTDPPEPFPARPAGIPFAMTVDDGGVSYYTNVAPRLETFGWRGHCLVTTGCIGRRGFLDARQIRELHARGHCIGTHSVSHPQRFAALDPERMLREWRDSRRALEDLLGTEVTVGSVPGGDFSQDVAAAADAAGLRVLFTSEPQTGIGRAGACEVLGRFTLRAGSRPDFARQLATLHRPLLAREWLAWNAKKMLKGLLGPRYPQLTDWVSRAGARTAAAGGGLH